MVEESNENDDHCRARVLDFSSSSMNTTDCEQLCKNIVNSDTLDSIRFSDCLLQEEVAKSIINALADCKSIKVADFKGNNLRVSGAEQLCDLLKQTVTLTELYLEWNSLGLHDTSMGAIADGLAVNKSVEILDLSRNQISHSGGRFLSSALKQNKTLKSLDLRWNNIGVAGGRELLSALQDNKSIINIQLDGNNILGDTLNAISTAIQRNVDHQSLCKQHDSIVQSLKEEIHRIENEKNNLAIELEKGKELHESTHCELEELKSTLDYVSSEKVSKENELKTARENISSLEENISDLTKINSELRSTHLEEMKIFEESMSNERKMWETEVAAKDSLISTLRKEKESQQNELDKKQSEINNLEKLLNLKEDNQIAEEQKYQREKGRINREYEELVKSLTDKIMKHLHDKEQLEEEITKLKTNNMNNKLMFDEDLANQRSRWKQEDNFKSRQYEERIDILVASKDELQSKLSSLVIQETETRAKLVVHQKDIENHKQVIVQNQEDANRRDQEQRNEMNKLKNEIDQEKRLCRNLRAKIEDAEKKSADIHCEMTDMKTIKDSEIALKKNEILLLKEKVKNEEENTAAKESVISTLRKEKEIQYAELEKNRTEMNNLQNLLKLKEDNQIADEQKNQREKERTNKEFEEQVKSLTDKITKYLHDKEELEEEITRLKTSIMNNKLMFDEELANQRSKWKQEDNFKSKQYEGRIDILVASNDELKSKVSWLVIQETETHAKLVAYQKDIENYKKAILQNQESTDLRDKEHRNEMNNLRMEIDQEKKECHNLRESLEDIEKKYAVIQCEMTQLRTEKDSEIILKENEILSLKEIVKNEEEDIKRIRQEELSRSNMLESALQSYIQSARSAKE